MKALYDYDLEIFRAIHVGLHRDWLDPIFWIISTSGLGWVQVVLVLAIPLYFAGEFTKKKRLDGERGLKLLLGASVRSWKDPAFLAGPMVAVIAFSGLVMSAVTKSLVGRERPSRLWFSNPQETIYANSYPSGHTTTTFAIAFMLVLITYKTERSWIGTTALLWAVLVGLSRIYRGVHWPSDVLGGIFAGLFSAAFIYLIMRRTAKATDVDDTPLPDDSALPSDPAPNARKC